MRIIHIPFAHPYATVGRDVLIRVPIPEDMEKRWIIGNDAGSFPRQLQLQAINNNNVQRAAHEEKKTAPNYAGSNTFKSYLDLAMATDMATNGSHESDSGLAFGQRLCKRLD